MNKVAAVAEMEVMPALHLLRLTWLSPLLRVGFSLTKVSMGVYGGLRKGSERKRAQLSVHHEEM